MSHRFLSKFPVRPYVFTSALLILAGGFFIAHAFTNPTQSPPNGNPGPIPVTIGGTGANSIPTGVVTSNGSALSSSPTNVAASTARSYLGAAASGANTDITSLTPYTGNPLSIGSAGLKFSDNSVQTTAASGSQWTTSGSNIYYGTGDVGIGTTNITHTLEVGGNSCLGSEAFCAGDGNEIWTQPGTNGAATLYINYRGYNESNTQPRNLSIDNGENQVVLYVAGAGTNEVGIDTGSPDSPLTVAGKIHSTTGGIEFPDGTTQTTAAGTCNKSGDLCAVGQITLNQSGVCNNGPIAYFSAQNCSGTEWSYNNGSGYYTGTPLWSASGADTTSFSYQSIEDSQANTCSTTCTNTTGNLSIFECASGYTQNSALTGNNGGNSPNTDYYIATCVHQ